MKRISLHIAFWLAYMTEDVTLGFASGLAIIIKQFRLQLAGKEKVFLKINLRQYANL